jgi:hypothetical protein
MRRTPSTKDPKSTKGRPDRVLRSGTEEWRIASARAAWLFWLVARRQRGVSESSSQELAAWESEAVAYRKYVRTVMRGLEAEGYSLIDQKKESEVKNEH